MARYPIYLPLAKGGAVQVLEDMGQDHGHIPDPVLVIKTGRRLKMPATWMIPRPFRPSARGARNEAQSTTVIASATGMGILRKRLQPRPQTPAGHPAHSPPVKRNPRPTGRPGRPGAPRMPPC